MGYTSQQYLLCDNSSDANFRSWGSAISAAILAMGWVQAADTGQVNWTTVTSPAGGSFVYEIWKPGDAGTVFYLKVEYGSSTAGVKGPRIRMSMGSATNGAGTLSGLVTAVFDPVPANNPGAGTTTYECSFSGDTNRLGMLLWRTYGNPVLFVVERTKNTDSTDSSDGVTILLGSFYTGTNGNSGQQTLVFGVGVGLTIGNQQGNFFSISDSNVASGAFNNNIPMSPGFPYYGKYGNPMTVVGFVHTQDVAEGTFFTTTLYGSVRTYIATSRVSVATPAGSRICMRFD